jgi:uncharacterized membrane protein
VSPVEGPHAGDNGKTARNIEAILKLEKDGQSGLSPTHRVFHKVGWFVGTVYFSIFQCLGLLFWIGLNAGTEALRQPFDPYPFPLLSALLSLEAVFLTSFVLIRQTAIDMQAERRNHLDLQINMLAEEEATAILRLLRQLAEHLDLDQRSGHAEETTRESPVENIARHLKARETTAS